MDGLVTAAIEVIIRRNKHMELEDMVGYLDDMIWNAQNTGGDQCKLAVRCHTAMQVSADLLAFGLSTIDDITQVLTDYMEESQSPHIQLTVSYGVMWAGDVIPIADRNYLDIKAHEMRREVAKLEEDEYNLDDDDDDLDVSLWGEVFDN